MSDIFDPSKLDVDFSKIDKVKKDSKKEEDILGKIDIKPGDNKPVKATTKKVASKKSKTSTTQKRKIPIKKISKKEEKKDSFDKYASKKVLLGDRKKSPAKKSGDDTEPERIIDINIKSIENLINILSDNKYDFLTIEPLELDIRISCHKNSKIVDTRYVRYHIYSKILINTKQLTNLEIEEIDKEQEGKGIYESKDKKYNIVSKTVPSTFGEKVFLKATEVLKEKTGKKQQKASLGKILGVLGAASFVTLILGGAFITFVVLNATNLEDVNFFHSLGINLNDINSFIAKIVVIIFSILLFIETIFSAIYLFKFFLTKKKYRKKKVMFAIISTIAVIVTFVTGSIWMIVDQKIRSLPNWQELAYGNIQLYDNSMLISKFFTQKASLIQDTSNLIGPITIKYDLNIFEKNEKRKGLKVNKYMWNIAGEKIEELNPTLIKEFDKRGTYEVSLTVEEVGLNGKVITKEVENIGSVSIGNVVELTEEVTSNGGKMVRFDASDLKELGKVAWYTDEDTKTPIWEDSYIFKPSKIFFSESMIGVKIKRNGKEDEGFDKVFIVQGDVSNDIEGEIEFTQSLKDDLEYELKVINPKTNFGEGFIEEFEWVFGEKTIVQKSDPIDLEKSSTVKFKFSEYGKNKVGVILKDSSGQYKKIETTIDIPKRIKLKKNLDIYNEDKLMKYIRYNEKDLEYFIDELGVPTTLRLDARFVKPIELIYSLEKVTWDLDNDGGIDKIGKAIDHEIVLEGNHTIVVNYKFVHRKIKDDIVNVKERIYIEAIKKDAILDLRIEKESDYVPMIVRFDASKSYIKNDDIVKFIYNYGDGIEEERDSINPGHKYTEAGDYKVKLTVLGKKGNSYSLVKDLILKPEPQKVKIGVSIKEAPVGQGIDFYSSDSQGQIIGYFWDFGDGDSSAEANPSHEYDRVGTYKVKLKIDFVNSNSLEDEMEMEIVN